MGEETRRSESLYSRIVRFNQRANRFYWSHAKIPPDVQEYRALLDRELRHARVALHLGAGGRDPRSLTSADLSKVALFSLDASQRSVARNPNRLRLVAWGHQIPLGNDSVDLVFSEYLMEHVAEPEGTVREAYRILRPGGALVWMAPNLWCYSGLATRLTPLAIHQLATRLLQPVSPRRAGHDVFKTYFRINSAPRIRRIIREAGFDEPEIRTSVGAPHYTQVLPVVHQLAVAWHLAMDRLEWLRAVRPVHLVRALKPAHPEA